ncbi:ATP-binding protein [Solidesulfovibrio sp.]|uniref:ATP-binding protein n=1 Tax=Solidesulfovibrio sp. TaxID=2910990 RepID=UPI002B1F9543|nr:ATP-binding protein [Solidesulfovibrio sp.]MEA4858087.1 ATP-binding protein [Solidesulfovibrio sp.]
MSPAGTPGPDADLGPYLRALFAAVDEGLCLLDAAGGLVASNPAMGRRFGGRACPGAAAGQGQALCGVCPALESLDLDRPVSRETVIEGPDGVGRHVLVTSHPLPDGAGGRLGSAVIIRDVTARVAARREMELVTRDIEMLLGSIRSILVTLDGENRVRRFNASAEAAFGLGAAQALGRDFFELGLGWDGSCVRDALAKSRETLLPARVDEVRCRLPSGDERLLGLTVNPVPGADAPPGVLILGQDLSEIKARELKVLHERRMQAMGQLASGIAHEINTPIQYVGYNAGFLDEAFADLLALLAAHDDLIRAADGGGGPALEAALRRVRDTQAAIDLDYLRQEIPAAVANTRKGIRQVAEIVAAMRQMSHPGTGEPIFFDLNAAARDIVTITRNAWKHVADVDLDLAPELPLVYGRPHEVSQVLLNVVLNAAQAVEEGFAREGLARGHIVIGTALASGNVVVSVADNGPGIDPADAGRIFDPFFTTKAAGKGTGQGLAIGNAIMARHGGSIDFTSRPGEGAVFHIRFPIVETDQHRP